MEFVKFLGSSQSTQSYQNRWKVVHQIQELTQQGGEGQQIATLLRCSWAHLQVELRINTAISIVGELLGIHSDLNLRPLLKLESLWMKEAEGWG